ncbi:hypothetical protein [Cryobacterium serini]|uniref:Glycosyltransferase n=1 Tax=Cryobacterium serini TaxID=1259201 RepID=A0A4R9BKX3_9MICO|nr:hypothetical protein [Cryobacterium serini]TFD86126.1 hypothetical protein E3T51_13405 [Cryobacterium serini]
MRIFFLNNYSMTAAAERVENGDYPGHHLWGYNERRPEDTWVIPPSLYDLNIGPRKYAPLVRRVLVRSMGDPRQQLFTLLRARRGDTIYAADQRTALLLGIMKRLRLIQASYLVVVHHAPRFAWEKASLSGASHIFVLSARTLEVLTGALTSPPAPPVTIAPWGPHLGSPLYRRNKKVSVDLDFIAAGKTNRDYANLREAAQIGKLSGIIYDGVGKSEYKDGVPTPTQGPFNYAEVVASMMRARCVVIPLLDLKVMAGLTEVADAIALDLPLIVSRSEAFPYDLEANETGCFIEHGSAEELLHLIRQAAQGAVPSAGRMRSTNNTEAYGDAVHEVLKRFTS